MSIQITQEQITALAPDASAASAGKKLGVSKKWQALGQNAEALWGECQGSALYYVRINLATLASKCSCPSRKFPCKHALGLLTLVATTPEEIPQSPPPSWVTDWLNRQQAVAKRRANAASGEQEAPSESALAAQKKRADKRLTLVNDGIQNLELWLNDLIRNGLADAGSQGITIWEDQAAQMVDAQAPGLASRLRALSAIPNASPDWPERLLGGLGKLALLLEAYHKIDSLPDALQADVRQLIGWNINQEELEARGEKVQDDWIMLSQEKERVETARRLRIRQSWLLGVHTHRSALILDFAGPGQDYPDDQPAIGQVQPATLLFWPGAYPQRARIHQKSERAYKLQRRIPGHATIEAFLGQTSEALARQPWLENFLCILEDVIPTYQPDKQQWYLRDSLGAVLPLKRGQYWDLLATSGGQSLLACCEWNGDFLSLFGVQTADLRYQKLKEEA